MLSSQSEVVCLEGKNYVCKNAICDNATCIPCNSMVFCIISISPKSGLLDLCKDFSQDYLPNEELKEYIDECIDSAEGSSVFICPYNSINITSTRFRVNYYLEPCVSTSLMQFK